MRARVSIGMWALAATAMVAPSLAIAQTRHGVELVDARPPAQQKLAKVQKSGH